MRVHSPPLSLPQLVVLTVQPTQGQASRIQHMLNVRITMVLFVEISTEVFSVNSEKTVDILTDVQIVMGTIP